FLMERNYKHPEGLHAIAKKLLQADSETYLLLHDKPIFAELQPLLNDALDNIHTQAATTDMEEIFSDERVAFAKGAVTETVRRPSLNRETATQKIDKILIHPLFGLPIFLLLMMMLFQLTFSLGSIPQEWIGDFFALLAKGVRNLLGDNTFSKVIADGALSGVGAVVMFLPNILILFFGIALLETTGYMSRVAFLLDGFFHKFGLHGKSFIPLVTGFGCTVPAYMAARTLKNENDRILTLFVLGFVSCSARLPIYVLFIGAFFPARNAGAILFLIYVSGALFALFAAKLLKMTAFRGSNEPFVMEMPKYRLPTFKLLWRTVYAQALSYLRKAGTFILVASIVIWFASNYPESETDDPSIAIENSYLGQFGKMTQPFFAPLGFDWKMSVALEAGLAAKEVVVSTMAVLHGVDADTPDEDMNKRLIQSLRERIPLPSAIAFIVFVMLYLPCFAASFVFAREAGGWRYLGYLFFFTTAVAWLAAFIAKLAAAALVS
ncbi:MAG: ferrous iron transport protein B, partial [Victivallales bacterium]|nr:ferrous iron transport protein B [Victivallales bacterium]